MYAKIHLLPMNYRLELVDNINDFIEI